MAKKLAKAVEGSILTITEGTLGEEMSFDINELNEAIRGHLSMHGLSQKLGDSAAGKEGQEAIDSIKTVWNGLVKGDWTVRAPAGEKVSKKSISEALGKLSPEDQAKAQALLAQLGFKM